MKFKKSFTSIPLVAFILSTPFYLATSLTKENSEFTLPWLLYVGWVVWDDASYSGRTSTNYFDTVAMFNADVLTTPAASSLNLIVVLVSDFSHDNVVLNGAKPLV